jgi:diacylglycerol kinase family enzyme
VASGRFLRRAALRAGLGATAAAPLGAPAAGAAALAGGAQEHVGAAAVLAPMAALLWLRRRSEPGLAWRLVAGVAVGIGTRFVWPVAAKAPAEIRRHGSYTNLAHGEDGEGVGIVVNPRAGSGTIAGGPSPAEALRAGLPKADIVEMTDGDDLVALLEGLVRDGCGAIGVAGGDGSINAAAGVAASHRLPLVVVPAGTLNHLARDLGVETVEDAIDAVRAGHAAEIDVARIAGEPFLNTASFGSYVELVDAREELEGRIGKWPALAVALVRVLRHGTPVTVELDGRRRTVWLAFIGNCRYLPDGVAPTWRERLDDGELDVRIVDAAHPFCRTRLVLAVLTGTLRRSKVFETWRTRSLTVASADGPLRLARDGETFDGADRFEIAKNGSRLAVFTPRRD